VVPRHRYFVEHLNVQALPVADEDWLKCDEQKLLELTAGKVFYDPHGELAQIRTQLNYYPPAVRFFLLRTVFARLSECGAAERALRRNDWLTIHAEIAYFTFFVIKAAHLIQQRYCPYHKWMARNLLDLGELGAKLHAELLKLNASQDPGIVREGLLAVLQRLGSQICAELAVPPPRTDASEELTLLAFDWDAVLDPLRKQIPKKLTRLSSLVTPAGYLGRLFDYSGYGGTYENLLVVNLDFLRGNASQADT